MRSIPNLARFGGKVRSFRYRLDLSQEGLAERADLHRTYIGYRRVPPAVPAGLPFNVAQLYMRMAEGIREGKSVSPDFDVAIKRYQLLDAIEKASDTGIRQVL